jgi:hypothetical protein
MPVSCFYFFHNMYKVSRTMETNTLLIMNHIIKVSSGILLDASIMTEYIKAVIPSLLSATSIFSLVF